MAVSILGRQTVNDIELLQVDGDPSVTPGLAANLGSQAFYENGTVGKSFLKIGPNDTDWDYIPTLTTGNVASGTYLNIPIYSDNPSGAHLDDVVQQNSQNISIGIVAQGTRSAPIAYRVPNPGDAVTSADFVLTEGAQTINGDKTFGNNVIVNGNLTVNGSLTYLNTTQTTITDPLITLNKGGAAASGAGVGIEIEEGSAITGYFKTNVTRDGWVSKVPANANDLTLSQANLTAARTLAFPDTSGVFVARPSATPGVLGQVAFWQDANNLVSSASLFWDTVNSRFGINTNTPSVALHVVGNARVTGLNQALPVVTDVNGNLSNAQISLSTQVTGVLPIANGGTGLNAGGTANQVLMMDAAGTNLGYRSFLGTTNQVNLTYAAGSVTFSTPQDIHSGASPTFLGLTLSSLTQGSVVFAGASGVISQDNANFFWDNTNKRLGIATNTPARTLDVNGKVIFRGSQLYNDSAAPNANFEQLQAQVSTTDATVTTLATIATASDTMVLITARVQGRRTGGTAGTAGDSAVYIRTARFKNVGGTLTKVTEQADYTSEDQKPWDCTFDINGTSARIRVAGAANNNVSWTATYWVQVLA